MKTMTNLSCMFASTGKKINAILKTFEASLEECSSRQPSCLFLDDLDALCPPSGDRNGQQLQPGEVNYRNGYRIGSFYGFGAPK